MGENKYDDYWINFGYSIAGPIAYAFTSWIWKEIEKDKSITDVFFIARDGYLPNLIFSQLNSEHIKTHYVYAPRSVLLRNNCEELKEYSDYISNLKIAGGTIAVVDTKTYRLSAQSMINRAVNVPTIGLYWMLTPSARKTADELGLSCISFKQDNERQVSNWGMIEFILSAPEMPIRSIKNGKPQYITENKDEIRKNELYSDIVKGVKQYLESPAKIRRIGEDYQSVYKLMKHFTRCLTENDINHLSTVFQAGLPDHSDRKCLIDQQLSFAQKVTNKINHNRIKNRCVALRIKRMGKKRFRGTEEQLVQELTRYDVISFDVFDTLIKRKCLQPSDIFEQLEKENHFYDFKNTRMRAEQEVKGLHPETNNEASIYEIYDVMKHYYGDDILRYIDREIELELEYCASNPFMLKVFDRIKETKKTIVIISDMYLPKHCIEELLHKCKITGYTDVYVSCEYHHSKKTGMLYDIVRDEYGKNLKYIHIGDNVQVDYIMAKGRGWDALLI